MENLGPYKFEDVLGRGGMGTVYRAIDTETNETLAVKVLAPVYSTDDHFRSRFELEIKALLKLDHPNIVRLIGYGQDDSNLYFAMELVDGQSLFQIQRESKPLHWREVIRIAKNVALGLRHAHDRGIIHRDLKPGNLLLANTGIIKITDFGIAKSFGQNQNTGTNVLGTVDFMSPEQAKGEPVNFRSDLYSLGTVMYTLLAGQPPFTANSVEESMRNLTRVPAPRIGHRSPDVPQALDDLIAQLLEKKPDDRIQTAMALYHQLKQVEKDLLDTSQAKTAERPLINTSGKTLVNRDPKTSVEDHRRSAQTIPQNATSKSGSDLNRGQLEDQGEESSPVGRTSPELKKAEHEKQDYFNTVTDNERLEHLDVAVAAQAKSTMPGKLMLVGLLLAVIIMGTYGIVRASRIPSAEALFAKIEQSWDRPQKRIGEIKTFLENYPDHEKSTLVEERRDIALAFQKVHHLRARRNVPDSLTEIESSFLSIVDGSSEDAPEAVERLTALITLHTDDGSDSEEDSACIAAARSYLVVLSTDARNQIEKVRSNIENQFKRATNLPKAEALSVYHSIIELNQQYSWVSDQIDDARKKIDLLNEL